MKWLHITPEVKIMVFYDQGTEKTSRSKHKPWEYNENPYKEISNADLLDDLYRLASC